jgi:hypothetical protein
MLYLPDPGAWARKELSVSPVVPRDTLVAAASTASEQQEQLAAENTPLRVFYGTNRVAAKIANMLSYNGATIIHCVWGHAVDAISALEIDDKPVPPGVTFRHYNGYTTEVPDPTLVAAFNAVGIVYADALPGVAYSVVSVPFNTTGGIPRPSATIIGRRVWTGSMLEYSDVPAWCLADFITNVQYGATTGVDYSSAASVADDNSVLVGLSTPERLRTLNLVIDTIRPVDDWLDVLRTYAGCWIVRSGDGLKLVSDKAGTPVAHFDHAAGNLLRVTNIEKRGVQAMPTVLTVIYRDTTAIPHRDGSAVVYAPGVLAGITPRRESSVPLNGITRYSQAFREATERLNKLLLNDLSFTITVFDEAIAIEVGDIVAVTHPIGFTYKQMRVLSVDGSYGRYDLGLGEYDPAAYSDSVATGPTYEDTALPNPTVPPLLLNISMAEEVIQLENGLYASRWRVTWDAADYPYLAYYRAELYDEFGLLIHASSPFIAEWPTPAVQENVTYTVRVAAVSTIGSTGLWAAASERALGKQLIPGDVPSISAFEAGGRVYATWKEALDIDIWRYELRYSPVGVSWENATFVDRVDALRAQSDQIPVGTWTLHVKALDSIKQYSALAATVNVVVTSDSNAFLINSYDQTAPTLTNMAEFRLARDDATRYFVTDDNVAVGTKFAGSLASFPNVMATYHGSVTSEWLGEAEDYGLLLGGQWTVEKTSEDISGAHTTYFGHSVAGSVYTYIAGLSHKLNARFARIKHEALASATLLVKIPLQRIRLDAIPREEVGTFTSSASGPVTITLMNSYVAVKKLTITPFGNTARTGVPDNIVLGAATTFDLYVFDENGTRIVSTGTYQFQGV